uniref:DM domain-containing protein n=1 Tax=Parastrongyloides trichosuri TaxID=131310 RepID=A0A0N4ZAT9_PARTI
MENQSSRKRLYFCQRCINHDLKFLRRGHKDLCSFAKCKCPKCEMVEKRRTLNSSLSKKISPVNVNEPMEKSKGRIPTCALCSAHGYKAKLRGHRKSDCPFKDCGCDVCEIVIHRRNLMAAQIKLRRHQTRTRESNIIQTPMNLQKFSFANLPQYVELQNNLNDVTTIEKLLQRQWKCLNLMNNSNTIIPNIHNLYNLNNTFINPNFY